MATTKKTTTKGRAGPSGRRSGTRTSDAATRARGGGRVTLHLTPPRMARAKVLAVALGIDLMARGGWSALWDAMADALEKKVAAEKG